MAASPVFGLLMASRLVGMDENQQYFGLAAMRDAMKPVLEQAGMQVEYSASPGRIIPPWPEYRLPPAGMKAASTGS